MQATVGHRTQAVTLRHGKTWLRGTIYRPPHDEPCPIVVVVPGHGVRANSLDAHGTFDYLLPLIGDYLLQKGIAVLHYDRPGTGRSTGDWRLQTLYDRADEVVTAVAFLREAVDIPLTQIGVIGHSNGGWVAPLAATLSNQIQFIVTIAGPGISLGAQALSAFQFALRNNGVSMADRAQLISYAQTILTLYRLLVQGRRTEFAVLKQRLQMEQPPQSAWLREFAFALPDWEERSTILQSMDGLVDYDPVIPLRGVSCPVLAIFGEEDGAFDALESAAIFAQAFREGGNAATTIHILPGADHRMQCRQPDGSMGLEPSFQALVATWIAQQTGLMVV